MATVKKFTQPQQVYRLEYPTDWENLQEDEGRSCGFGPSDRDNVGLWISVMPMSLDTDRIGEDFEKLFQKTLDKTEAANMRKDSTLRHYGLKADVTKEGEAGNFWLMAGGDVVLFASTQVPAGERDEWNRLFEKVMASLQITRSEELIMRKAANEVIKKLSDKHPDQEFEFDDKGIRTEGQSINLENMYREVRSSPKNWQSIARNFAKGILLSMEEPIGSEEWQEVIRQIIPVVKPIEYIKEDTPTKHLYTNDWLKGMVICYVIKSKKHFRFITGWDIDRWGITAEDLEKTAMHNLQQMPWPRRLEGARETSGGRVIVVDTPDGLASSRILHPDLYKLFSGPLGTPFWAGIPDRATLVVFSNRKALKKRIGRKLKKDCDSSPHPITERPFLVTRDGIALGLES